jgi:transposase
VVTKHINTEESLVEQEHRMLDARILQAQGYTQMQIAEMLHDTDRTVRNDLRYPPRGRKRPVRSSKVDPHKALIDEVLEANPRYNSELLFERLLRLRCTGKKSILKNCVAGVRRRLLENLLTHPGRVASTIRLSPI